MVNPLLDPQAPLSPAFRAAVSTALTDFVGGQSERLAALGPELAPVTRLARDLLAGGKRVRPAFCVWGYVAAADEPSAATVAPLLAAAASLDLLHVSALVHDDVMDGSDTRRGRPSAHRQFEELHRRTGQRGDPSGFGQAGAILLGDLLLMWSVEMLQRSGLPPVALGRGLPLVEAMRTEVTCGQYLDVLAQSRPFPTEVLDPAAASDAAEADLVEANRVVEFKSARYTVQRPVQLGASLGGAPAATLDALAAFGSPVGRAFQFRDDLLGVFGDAAVTGKPCGDDLREGKRTVLIAHALGYSEPSGRALLHRRLGDPHLDGDGVAELQDVIETSGARRAVEAMIEESYQRGLTALQGATITDLGRRGLTALADAAVRRTF